MDRRRNSQLIQQLVQALLCRTLERLLFVLADFTKEDAQLEIFPNRQHVDDTSQLHHELTRGIERIVVGRIENVDGP